MIKNQQHLKNKKKLNQLNFMETIKDIDNMIMIIDYYNIIINIYNIKFYNNIFYLKKL